MPEDAASTSSLERKMYEKWPSDRVMAKKALFCLLHAVAGFFFEGKKVRFCGRFLILA